MARLPRAGRARGAAGRRYRPVQVDDPRHRRHAPRPGGAGARTTLPRRPFLPPRRRTFSQLPSLRTRRDPPWLVQTMLGSGNNSGGRRHDRRRACLRRRDPAARLPCPATCANCTTRSPYACTPCAGPRDRTPRPARGAAARPGRERGADKTRTMTGARRRPSARRGATAAAVPARHALEHQRGGAPDGAVAG